MIAADFSMLDRVGLNLHAVFDVDALPCAMQARLRECTGPAQRYRQLVLIGNAGPRLWASVKAAAPAAADPIDEFSIRSVAQWFAAHFGDLPHHRLYPGEALVDLQGLGELAGWHHPTPFKVGIQQRWGTWFAYRVALLADTALAPTEARRGASPCDTCRDTPCIPACPAGAMAGGEFSLASCIAYRRQPASRCAATCVARLSCPVGAEHRYAEEQIRHGYSNSLKMIEWYDSRGCAARG